MINMMTPTLTSSCAKSIMGLCNLSLQIGDYRPRFSRMLRPLTWLKTHAISILLYHWNKLALGDQVTSLNSFYIIDFIKTKSTKSTKSHHPYLFCPIVL